jgi:pSer/pThr/pTyr-binding forkhead associated (FHA) protein
MEPGIGIVCGRCESYATLGSTTCKSCGNGLVLDPGEAAPTSAGRPVSSPSISVASKGRETADFADAPQPRPSANFATTQASNGVNKVSQTSMEALTRTLGHEDKRETPAPASVRGSGGPKGARNTQKSIEELMDQAKNFVCRSCSTGVPLGHKFCGRCGAAVPPEIMAARTQFFGQLQTPGKAKLILIRGEGVEGLSYQLNAEQHVVGRAGQLVFPDDPFVSPRHANFFYRNGVLCVRDEGSTNGVYLRVRGTIDVAQDDFFLAGEQVFRFNEPPSQNDAPGPDGTYFYSSPKQQAHFRVTQILQGGMEGMIVCARQPALQIGREGGDLNFPTDLYMSGSHCKIELSSGKFTLTDMGSRNGTYIRLKAERELGHGDYLFIGRKLLRVEITAA